MVVGLGRHFFLMACMVVSLNIHDRALAQEQGLTPLQDMINDEFYQDEGRLTYLTVRCSALFLTTSLIFDVSGKDDIASFFDEQSFRLYSIASTKYAEYNSEYAQERLSKTVEEIQASYAAETNANWISSGSYFSGSYVEGDLSICKDFASSINKAIGEQKGQ